MIMTKQFHFKEFIIQKYSNRHKDINKDAEIDKLILKFMYKRITKRTSKTNTVRGLTLPDIKTL